VLLKIDQNKEKTCFSSNPFHKLNVSGLENVQELGGVGSQQISWQICAGFGYRKPQRRYIQWGSATARPQTQARGSGKSQKYATTPKLIH
jgi:hypothetical protein